MNKPFPFEGEENVVKCFRVEDDQIIITYLDGSEVVAENTDEMIYSLNSRIILQLYMRSLSMSSKSCLAKRNDGLILGLLNAVCLAINIKNSPCLSIINLAAII